MAIDQREKYAAEFGVYLAGVTLLVAGFLALWIKAINVGGFWWIATAVLFVLGVILGEYLKRRIESLISLSRALRNQKQGD